MTKQDNPFFEFEGSFCKVIIRRYDNRSERSHEKSLKGIIECKSKDLISIKGDYQMTTVHVDEVVRVTTRSKVAG